MRWGGTLARYGSSAGFISRPQARMSPIEKARTENVFDGLAYPPRAGGAPFLLLFRSNNLHFVTAGICLTDSQLHMIGLVLETAALVRVRGHALPRLKADVWRVFERH